MPTDSRAANAIRTSAAKAARRPPALSNRPKGGGGASWAVKIIVLAVLAVAAHFVWKKYKAFEARPKPPPPPKVQEEITPFKEPEREVVRRVAPTNRLVAKKRRPLTIEEQIALEVAREEVPDARRKIGDVTVDPVQAKKDREAREARLKARYAAAVAAREKVEGEIAAARKDPAAKALTGFKGITFGAEQQGVPSVWGPVLETGETQEARGVTYAIYGAPVEKGVGTLGKLPLVWVTPKTRRAWRVSFGRPVKATPGNVHDAETAKLVDLMKAALKREPFVRQGLEPKLAGADFVFPLGETTVRVGEYGGQVMLIAEHEGFRAEAKAEAEALRVANAANESEDDVLVSAKYPQGPAVSFKGLVSRFREGTPKTFCGLTFGRQPSPAEEVTDPKNGHKGFFLDYQRAKCRAFKGFVRGRAEIDPYRGGVYRVTLYNNEGGADGVYDADFFKSVRAALDRQYLVTPEERKGTRDFPELVYAKGDVTITFAPDRNGGFRLSAVHQAMEDIAKVPVREKRRR